MKNFKVVLLLAGLSTGLIASENNGSENFMSRFSVELTSLYTRALTAGNDYVAQPLSQATTSALTAGNDYVVKPVSEATSKVVAAISNSSAAAKASELSAAVSTGTSNAAAYVAKSASDVSATVSTKANEFGTFVSTNASHAANVVATKSSEFGDVSAKFYENNKTAVQVTAVVVTVATIAAIIKYQRDGFVFYASEASEEEAA